MNGVGATAPEPHREERSVSDDVDVSTDDEERVERLLEENGGRMNRPVSSLRPLVEREGVAVTLIDGRRGRVEKLRLGRENLISLPDEDEDEE